MSVGKVAAAAAVAGAMGLGAAGALGWVGGGSGGSSTSPSSASPATLVASATSPTTQAKAGRGGLLGLLRRTDHGTFEVRTKAGQWVTYTFDRGKVTAVNGQTITLARPDGQSTTLTITPETRFRGVATAQDVQTGKGAIVVSKDGNAVVVAQRDPRTRPARPAQPAQPAPTS
jgi:hypothetical protein